MARVTAQVPKKPAVRNNVRELTRAELAKLAGVGRPGEWHCVNKASNTHGCTGGVSE